MAPELPQASFFTLSAPNVEILAFKPSEDGNPEHYTIRLQEIAGKETDVDLKTPLKITEAEETSMNEDRVLGKVSIDPLRMHLLPHETFTLRITAPHSHKKRSDRWWEW
jgi:alpha-mannosidase